MAPIVLLDSLERVWRVLEKVPCEKAISGGLALSYWDIHAVHATLILRYSWRMILHLKPLKVSFAIQGLRREASVSLRI